MSEPSAEVIPDCCSAVIEYAKNLDAIWHAPHADTATGLALTHLSLDRGFALLRTAFDTHYRFHGWKVAS